jgi:hypothetical protein
MSPLERYLRLVMGDAAFEAAQDLKRRKLGGNSPKIPPARKLPGIREFSANRRIGENSANYQHVTENPSPSPEGKP